MKKTLCKLLLLSAFFILFSCTKSSQNVEVSMHDDYMGEVKLGSSPSISNGIDLESTKKKYLYTLNLSTKDTDSLSDRKKVKGSNTYELAVDVWAKIANESDKEGQSFKKRQAEDKQFVYKDYNNIKVLLTSYDGSIKFHKGKQLVDTIVISKEIPDGALGNENSRILSAKESFVIDENYKNRKKETGIKAAVFLENPTEILQSQTLELEIVPLTFGEKLEEFYVDAATETINKMNVLYTALLGIVVSAIIAFVRRKLKVKEDPKA